MSNPIQPFYENDGGPFSIQARQAIHAITAAGHYADDTAAQHAFDDHLRRKAQRTQMAYLDDLATWADYLREATAGEADITAVDMLIPYAWSGTSWGLVEGFRVWMLEAGFAVTSLNRKLSTIRTFCQLAHKAGILADIDALRIANVTGYSRAEARRIDAERERTRRSGKKAAPTHITVIQARQLKRYHPDTPQGQRDAVIMCLLIDHGLRVGEIAILQVADVHLVEKTLRFFRPKVGKTQTHNLTSDTHKAMLKWMETTNVAIGPLLQSTRRDGEINQPGMTTQTIAERVREIGTRFGLQNLSPHDCRHYWATDATRNGTSITALRDAGGWSSLAMPAHYVAAAEISNQGVKQSK